MQGKFPGLVLLPLGLGLSLASLLLGVYLSYSALAALESAAGTAALPTGRLLAGTVILAGGLAGGLGLVVLALAQALQRRQLANLDHVRAREEADRANQAKREFLSRMSHELRTPLNSILGFGQLLELRIRDEADQDSVQQILKAGRNLLDLVNEVLDITRIEAKELSFSVEPVDTLEAIEDAVSLIRPSADERGISIHIDRSGEQGCYLMADRQRFGQILLNLLSNAVKYNRDHGRVEVTFRTLNPQTVRIEIRDTGPGIPPQFLERLFSPFDRLGREGQAAGTGLGLILSLRLAEAMGGRLGIESPPGQGALAWIEMNRAQTPPLEAEPGRLTPVAPAAQTDATAQAVLYIEDNLTNLKLMERLLSRWPDLRLLTALQGRRGLELAVQQHPSLILLDLHLPDIPGQEVLTRLRADERTRAIPVIVISADGTPGQIERLKESGAAAYLTKPFDVHRLLELASKYLESPE